MDTDYRPFVHRWAVYADDGARRYFTDREGAERFAAPVYRQVYAIRPSLIGTDQAIRFTPVGTQFWKYR